MRLNILFKDCLFMENDKIEIPHGHSIAISSLKSHSWCA